MNHELKTTIHKYYAFKFFITFHFFSAVLVPFFTDWAGLSRFQIQLLQSWFSIWLFILEVPTGVIADRFSRKLSILLGAFVLIPAVLVYGSFPSYQAFLIAEFCFALSFALISGADDAFIYDALDDHSQAKLAKKIMGRANAFQLAGIMIAAPIGGVIASIFGLNAPMLAVALPAGIAALIALTFKEPKVDPHTHQATQLFDIAKNGYRSTLNNITVRPIVIDAIMVSVVVYFMNWTYQPIGLASGIPLGMFGIIHAAFMATEIIISANFDKLERVVGGTVRYLRLTTLLVAGLYMLVAFLPTPITVILFTLGVAGFGYTRLELIKIHLNRAFTKKERATALSFISMARRLSIAIANPLIGLLLDHSEKLVLISLGTLATITALASPLRHPRVKQFLNEVINDN